MSGLNTQETQLLRVAVFEVSWLAGNAIAEACRLKKADLYREILTIFTNTVNSLDVDELSTRCFLPIHDGNISLFKELMKQGTKEGEYFLRTTLFDFINMHSLLTFCRQNGLGEV